MSRNNPLNHLHTLGQSVWLDYIRRDLISSGELRRLIKEDDLRGITSNPSIFEKAISESGEYDADILEMAAKGKEPDAIYEALSIRDIQNAADEFLPLYEKTEGEDGYVSLEVNPHLAHDTEGTIQEARHLWKSLLRPNVLIKVPGTAEGLPAIRQLIGEGINVNITLLFGLPRYREAAEAYLCGIESRVEHDKDVTHIASVSSFFVSRIDSLLDGLLDKYVKDGGAKSDMAAGLRGKIAVSSAKMAYQIYKELFGGERFNKLKKKGALPQRLLWASTSSKDPLYQDIKYVEALAGHDTVNTLSVETLNAYREHGKPESRLKYDLNDARHVLELLPELGLNIDKLTQQLEDEGIEKFITPYEKLMKTIAKRSSLRKQGKNEELK